MFDWQYELQKNLQKSKIINYTQQQPDNQESNGQITQSEKRQQKAENISIQIDRNLSTNITDTNNTDITLMDTINNTSTDIDKEISDESNNKTINISIVPGSGNPNSEEFYSPSSPTIQPSTTITWINDDNLPHTVTSGDPSAGPTGEFDSSIINSQETFSYTFEKEGVYNYYCTLHPWMIASVIVK